MSFVQHVSRPLVNETLGQRMSRHVMNDQHRCHLDCVQPVHERAIIFLDIDGVLVTQDSLRAGGSVSMDRRCVAELNRLVETTGAVIVITSSWRILHSIDFIVGAMCAAGFKGKRRVVDITDRLHFATPSGVVIGCSMPRAHEICEWLDEHPWVESFVVIDDDRDAEISGHFVRTDFETGLTASLVDQAARILRGGP